MSTSTNRPIPRSPASNRPTQEPPVELSATQARQGSFGRPVALVLAGGLILALIAWGAVEYWGETQDNAAEATNSEPAVHQSQPQPQSGNTADTAPSTEQKAGTAPTDRDPTYESGTGGQSPVVTPDGTQR
ncbi:MAG TPA: hypothetical protein VM468_05670 [Mycoplana sp.]|nr:hypothetical protein [Mycoplana sp.]